ncbi:HGxxPAAW family protein [Streptomyces sp. NPDC087440]|uniref:HGxxPAAW family protein n=1 Tax=Streptomyces sp. NPDC087440 TaxID=3365790 RepID=UPI00382EA7B8
MAGVSRGHHGRTPAAWTGVVIAFIGICVSSAYMVMAQPVGFWAGIGISVVGGLIGLGMKMAGLGMPKESSALVEARAAAGRAQLQ